MSSDYVLKPGTLWRLLQRLDVLRRPERVEALYKPASVMQKAD